MRKFLAGVAIATVVSGAANAATAVRSGFGTGRDGQPVETVTLPDLTPEIGNTIILGTAWQPTFTRGLGFSVDNYRVKVNVRIVGRSIARGIRAKF